MQNGIFQQRLKQEFENAPLRKLCVHVHGKGNLIKITDIIYFHQRRSVSDFFFHSGIGLVVFYGITQQLAEGGDGVGQLIFAFLRGITGKNTEGIVYKMRIDLILQRLQLCLRMENFLFGRFLYQNFYFVQKDIVSVSDHPDLIRTYFRNPAAEAMNNNGIHQIQILMYFSEYTAQVKAQNENLKQRQKNKEQRQLQGGKLIGIG